MKNIYLRIEYDGTSYFGWQRQQNAISIQQVIEEKICDVTGEDVSVIGSGRTDSGAHARGQVANFYTNSSIPPEKFSFVLNTKLPSDIRVKESKEVPMDFHARYCAVAKRYTYSMVLDRHGIAIGRYYYYNIKEILDIDNMIRGASIFQGTHDFKAFMSKGSSVKNTVRTIYSSRIISEHPFLYFDIVGNGFLYNMVRIMVGTLIEIGRGKLTFLDAAQIIKKGDRRLAGPTAPAHGLCLEDVYYTEEELFSNIL